MTPERWQEVKAALHQALDLDAPARTTYLERLAVDDPLLRIEVESLLAAHADAGTSFLSTPVPALLYAELPHNSLAGRRLGNYQLIEEIGAGGMGEVYRAVRADDEYRQEVAIKIVRTGLDPRLVSRRLRTERQILAGLEHPNIARLLDGGSTDEGVPYIVMELIVGVPITQFCDEQALNTNARLNLFMLVCAAVEYAHQHMIVHRDLKPSNILVTAAGVPKLLDFGIAKLLQTGAAAESADATVNAVPLLTPNYASPEQLRGESVTAASDVYSLGVVLYELLTGSRRGPGRSNGAQDSKEASGAVPHRLPKERERALRGDLDTILRMALHPQIERRYASVERFAEDIRRHLQHLPVTARRDTLSYRVSTFVTRHTLGVAVVAVAALALLGGILIATAEARIAREQRARAEQRFDDVRKLANSLIFDIHDAIRDLPGAGRSRRLLIETALHYLDSLSQEATGDVALQRELAVGYERLGDLQGQPLEASEGDYAGARQSYQRALELRLAGIQNDPHNAAARSDIVASANHLGDLLWLSGDGERALAYLKQALTGAEALVATEPGRRAYQLLLANARTNYSYKLYKIRNNPAQALPYMREGLAGLRAALNAAPADQPCARALSLAYTRAAEMLGVTTATYGDALAMNQNAQRLLHSLRTANPNSTDYAHLEGFADHDIAAMLMKMNRLADAQQAENDAAGVFQGLVAADPGVAEYHVDLALARAGMAHILERQHQPGQAAALLQVSFRESPPLTRGASTNSYFEYATATREELLGEAYRELATDPQRSRIQHQQDWLNARDWYQKSLGMFQALSAGSAEALAESRQIADLLSQCDRGLAAAGVTSTTASLPARSGPP
jgi:tRNA A-37 threonylcarbamoyl transferase component Bud32